MEDLLGADAPLTEPQEPLRQPQEQDPPPQDNIYRQNILRRQEQRRQMLVESFNVGVKSDPVKAREADRYARELGLPVGVAERKLDEVAAIVAKRNFDAEQMSALNPTLAQQLRDPAFARMAHDDIDNLSIYERAMRGGRVGELTAERGRVGIGLGVFDDPASRRRIAEIDEEMQRLGEPQGIVGNAAQFLGMTAKVAERATAVGSAAGVTVAVLGQLGPQVALPEELATVPAAFILGFKASIAADFAAINIGNEYANLVSLGVPRTTAQLTALGVGTVNTALDLGGFSLLTAPVRQALAKGAREAIVEGVVKPTIGKAAIKSAISLAKGAGGEIGTEMLQDVVSIVGEAAATGDPSRLDDMARRVGETGLKTAQAMVLIGTPGPIFQFHREVQRVKAAEQAQKSLDTMMAATANGKMHAENPVAFQKAVDAANPGTSYYIDGKTFAEVLAQRDEQEVQESPDALKKRLIERIPAELQVRIGDAIEKGGVVEMSPAEFLTAFGNTPEGKALQQHVRVGDPEAMTAAEAAKVDIDALAKDAETQAEKQQVDAETWTKEARAVEDDIATQIAEARPGKKMEAREQARGWRAIVETITDRVGQTPKWFAEQWKVKIQQGDVPDAALAQSDAKTDSPEFKAWFGEPKVVDKEGKPLVILRQDGDVTRGGFQRIANELRITLSKDANFSTPIHEMFGHALLEVYGDLAVQKAHPTIVDDFQALLDWGGIKDAAEWKALPIEKRKGLHEKFAREWEAFVWEGKEPSSGLKRLFAVLSRLMRRVYETIAGIPGRDGGAPPEVRAVLERMIASEQDVKVAQAIRGAVPLFQTQEESGLDDAAWAEHQAKQREAYEAARDDLTRQDLENMKWLGIQVGKIAAVQRKEIAHLREGERQKVAAAVEQRPVYRAMRWLKTGEMVNPDGTKTNDGLPHKLNREAVRDLLGLKELDENAGPKLPEPSQEFADRAAAAILDAEEDRARMAAIQVAKPEKALHKLKGMLAEKGYAPDDVAPLFDIETGEELVRGILEAPQLLDAIEARTDEVMLEKHTDLMDPRKRDATIERALHNETRRRFVASEIAVLMKAQQPVRVTIAAAKKAAEVAIGNKRVKELNPRTFTAAAKRASQDAVEARKAGEIENAIAAKRRELVLSEMALLAIDANKEVAKGEALFRQAARSDKEVSAKRDIDYVYAMRLLGSKFGLIEPIDPGQRSDLTAKALTKLVDERPDLASRVDALVTLASKGGMRYRDVAMTLFREVAELGSMLWDAAQDAKFLTADGKKKLVAEVVGALTEQIGKLPPPRSTKALADGGAAPPWRRAMLAIWDVVAAAKRMESVAWWLDGNKIGPFTRLIVQPIMRAQAKMAAAKTKMVAAVHADLMKVREAAGADWLAKIHADELDYTFANKSELLRAIAYMGTDSGARKWLLGERGKNGKALGDLVKGPDGHLVLDTSRWDAFIAKQWRTGKLTRADANFLTAIWGHFRELLPQAQAVHKAASGYEYETLAERPVKTPYGTLQGGYIPVRADYDKAKPTPNYLALDEIGKQRENIAFSIGTERGFTIKRNENYLQPLSLDLGKLLAHIGEELTFIHLELPTKDVAKIIKGSMEVENGDGTTSKVKMLDVLNSYDRAIVPNVLKPWLENVALQRTTRQGRWRAVDKAAVMLRHVASLSRLAGNVTNSLLQATGISVAASQTPRKFVWSALSTVLKNPAAAIRDMLDSSGPMRARFDADTAKLHQEMSRMNLGALHGAIKAAQQTTAMIGFWLTRKVQSLADVVSWQAAKAHAEAGGASFEDAVQAADGAVRRSQGGRDPTDLAAIEVQTPAVQLLFQFGSYSLTILNTMMSSRNKGSTLVWAVLLPTLIESLLRQAVRPPDDDDADGIIDEMAANYTEQLARNTLSMVPLVGPTALALATSEGVRVQDAPAISTVKDAVAGAYELVQSLGGDEITAADWRKISVFLTVVTQIPVAAPTSLAQDLAGVGR